jgi:hypothetical protein
MLEGVECLTRKDPETVVAGRARFTLDVLKMPHYSERITTSADTPPGAPTKGQGRPYGTSPQICPAQALMRIARQLSEIDERHRQYHLVKAVKVEFRQGGLCDLARYVARNEQSSRG